MPKRYAVPTQEFQSTIAGRGVSHICRIHTREISAGGLSYVIPIVGDLLLTPAAHAANLVNGITGLYPGDFTATESSFYFDEQATSPKAFIIQAANDQNGHGSALAALPNGGEITFSFHDEHGKIAKLVLLDTSEMSGAPFRRKTTSAFTNTAFATIVGELTSGAWRSFSGGVIQSLISICGTYNKKESEKHR